MDKPIIEKEQALLAKVLDLIAQRFDRKAILRGDMTLCILGSPRFTNDLDYLFVPYKSKKDILPEIVTCLYCPVIKKEKPLKDD